MRQSAESDPSSPRIAAAVPRAVPISGSAAAGDRAGHAATPSAAYTRYVLATLLGVYMIHHLDRMTIALLLEPIGREFGLSDSERGLLAGLAYAIPFAIAGIPLGMLIDRVNRVRLLATLLALWSGLTALCALATGFGWLLLARIGVGAAESGGTPANMSILSDYFPPAKRSRAFGIYYMAPHVGTIIGFALAGTVATAAGWRAAFLLVGLPGLLLVLLLLKTVREPRRGGDGSPASVATTAEPAPTLAAVLRALIGNRAAWHMLLGVTIASTVAAGTTTWLAPFLIRLHGVSVREAGFIMALGLSPLGALGSLAGGVLADRLGGFRSPRVARMLALAVTLAVPAAGFGLVTGSLALLTVALAAQLFLYVLVVGPSYAAVVGLMPVRMRGVSAAAVQVASNVLGFGVGAQVVGVLSDALKSRFGSDSLRYAMLALVLVFLWSGLHFLLAARALARGPGASAPDPDPVHAAASRP